MGQTFSNVGCPRCGCLCDDLAVTVEGGRVAAAERACHLAEPWFLSQVSGDGLDLTADALDRAAALLREARSPLITGLASATPGGLRAAVELADRLGATIDPAGPGSASALALARVGESTCTLGEVRHRADLILFWGCDPMRTHPRFLERFVDPAGRFVPDGRAGRRLIAVGAEPTESDAVCDEVVRLEPGGDWDALHALRLAVAGKGAGRFAELAARMKGACFGVVFHGDGMLANSPRPDRVVEELSRLVQELNDTTRFYSRWLRPGASSGAESLLAWQTGYPLAVNFAAGYPRSLPGEWSAPELLTRGEVDCVLVVGSEGLGAWPAAAKAALGRVPVIRLDPPGAAEWPASAVRFTTAVPGVHAAGTGHRLDDVGILLRVLLPGGPADDGEVLRGVLARLAVETTRAGGVSPRSSSPA